KRLSRPESDAAGLPPEDVAEEDLLDTAWVQRLRRVSQLQSARWVFPTAEHSRFTHGLGVMHEAGVWARSLYPSLRSALVVAGEPVPSEGLVVDAAMPRWFRWLQPRLSGVFTVDNLDYVRRDAYMTGVAINVDVERLRRYTFVGPRGLTLYEPGLGALEMFLTARLFLYQQVYFHRTVRAIDLDLAEVFAPSIRAIFGDGSPADQLAAFADLDEYALLHQAARLARGESVADRPTDGYEQVQPAVAEAWW